MSSSLEALAIKVIWKCTKPKSQDMVALCETLMKKAAQSKGMDTAIVRKEVHNTTRIAGKYVQTTPHITGDIINTKLQKGYALHYNVNMHNEPLPNGPAVPNPEFWDLVHKDGKGFILVGDETETVREVD